MSSYEERAEAKARRLGQGEAEAAHLLAALEQAQQEGYVLPERVQHAAARLRDWVVEHGDAPAGA